MRPLKSNEPLNILEVTHDKQHSTTSPLLSVSLFRSVICAWLASIGASIGAITCT